MINKLRQLAYPLIGIVTLSILMNIFLPPNGIWLSPIFMTVMVTVVTLKKYNFNVFWKSIFSYLVIGINDVCVKLFAGGTHDWQGQGWIHMLFFFGLSLSFLVLAIAIFRTKSENFWHKILSLLIFAVLIAVHLKLFAKFGMEI